MAAPVAKLHSIDATPGRSAADELVRAWKRRVDAWTAECPDPEHGIATASSERARRFVETALGESGDPILIRGPAGQGKTFLLRTFQRQAPAGFTSLLIPISNVEPEGIARWILSAAQRPPDAEPVEEALKQLLRGSGRADPTSSPKTLILLDEVQSSPPATIAKLFEILASVTEHVAVILAGWPGEALDRVVAAVPHPIRKLELAEPWTRAEAERLVERLARDANVSAIRLFHSLDVDSALRASNGNPRLLRAALGDQLRRLRPDRLVEGAPFAGERRRSDPMPALARLAAMASPMTPVDPPHPIEPPSPIRPPDPADPPNPIDPPVPIGPPRPGDPPPPIDPIKPPRPDDPPRPIDPPDPPNPVDPPTPIDPPDPTRPIDPPNPDPITPIEAARRKIQATWTIATVRDRIESLDPRRPIAVWRAGYERSRRSTRDALSGMSVRRAARSLVQPATAVGIGVATTLVFASIIGAIDRIARIEPTIGRSSTVAVSAAGVEDAVGANPIAAAPAVEPVAFKLNAFPWASIEVDGVRVGTTPITIRLTPGPHHFRARMSDGRVEERSLMVSTRWDHHAFR